MPFDTKLQRQIWGKFATGVTVVTTSGVAGPHGLTANAVASLSLEPSLVMVSVDKRAATLQYLNENKVFCINILARNQEDLSRRFATPGPKEFSDLQLLPGTTGAPILAGCLAYCDCRLVNVVPAGDHDLFIGEIVQGDIFEGDPLLYFSGKYAQIATA